MRTPKVPVTVRDVTDPRGRKIGESFEVACPYCHETHYHGAVLGTRVTHCVDARPNPGYDLCPPDADVDWESERRYAEAAGVEA